MSPPSACGRHPKNEPSGRVRTEYIIHRAADIVRSDVISKGGVTSTPKTIYLADCFRMNCEVHTSRYPLTDVANLHLVSSAKNCDFCELLFLLEFYSD